MLTTPTPKEIAAFSVSDHCNSLSQLTLERLGLASTPIRVEASVRQFPTGLREAFFFGQEDVRDIVTRTEVRMECLPDGAVFRENEPVLALIGPAGQIALLRTALTGVLTFYSSLITRMTDFVVAARPRPVHFFGLRKIHPSHALQYLLCAYIAGMEIDATGLATQICPGTKIADCQEHFANIVASSVELSWEAFLSLGVSHGALYIVFDNTSDPVEEMERALTSLGERLHGILVDLDSTRRGHLARVIQEIRWKLKLSNRQDIQICLTGGVTPQIIRETKDLVVSYGVGVNALQAPVLDFSFQVVEVGGRPRSKLGVLGGRKSTFLCANCGARMIDLVDSSPKCCGVSMRPLLESFDLAFDSVARRIEAKRNVAAYLENKSSTTTD